MSILLNSPPTLSSRDSQAPARRIEVLIPAALLLILTSTLFLTAPSALVLPAVSLIATFAVLVCGIAAWFGGPALQTQSLTAAGIFAFAAVAAAIIGDPDQVAHFLK